MEKIYEKSYLFSIFTIEELNTIKLSLQWTGNDPALGFPNKGEAKRQAATPSNLDVVASSTLPLPSEGQQGRARARFTAVKRWRPLPGKKKAYSGSVREPLCSRLWSAESR